MTQTATASPSASQSDPLAGTAYRVVRRIGKGAMGDVFEAEHTGLRRRVAVKLLSPLLAGDPVFVDRLRLEAQALASIRHPNVVLVHDHATTPAGVPYLVMELLHGRTLHELWRDRGTLPLLEALALMDQICAGLTVIHAAGLTHRDLKPANVFLCDSEERGRPLVKLLDFGIVKVTRRQSGAVAPLLHPTEQGQMIGTPRFMAPEQVRGDGCDARTDIYAASVLLYMLLAGRDPFHHHRGEVALLTAHAMEPPPPLPPSRLSPFPRPSRGRDPARAREAAGRPVRLRRGLRGRPARRWPGRACSRHPPRPVHLTEKIHAATWRSPAPGTAPIHPALFRNAAPVLPFAPSNVASTPAPAEVLIPPPPRLPPSFGLPPLALTAPPTFEPAGAPAGTPIPRELAPAPTPPSLTAWRPTWLTDRHLGWMLVALVWSLFAFIAWRVL